MRTKSGFTLIEIIVGIGLFAMVATTMTSMVAAILKSNRKADAVGLVKREGEYAMAVMENSIRYAQVVGTTSPGCCADNTCVSVTKVGTGEMVNFHYYPTPSPDYPQHVSSESGVLVTPLTSTRVVMSPCTGTGIFSCSNDQRYVDICFWLDTYNALDSSNKAGGSGSLGEQFQTRILLRNSN